MKLFKNTSKVCFAGLFAAFLGLVPISAAPAVSNEMTGTAIYSSSNDPNPTPLSSPLAKGAPKANLVFDVTDYKDTTTIPATPTGQVVGDLVLNAVPEPASGALGVCLLALIAVLCARTRQKLGD